MSFLYFILSPLLLLIYPQIYQKLNDDILREKAIEAFYNRDYDLSIKHFKTIECTTSNRENKLNASHILGHIYAKEKLNLKEGIKWFKKGLVNNGQKEKEIFSFQMLNYKYLSESYHHLGKLDSAEFYCREGVQLYFKYPEKFKNSSILNQLSIIFFHKKEYHLSREIQERDFLQKEKNYISLSNYLHLLIMTNDTTSHKIETYIQELQAYKNHKDNDGSHLAHIGFYHQQKCQYHKAINYYQSFLETYEHYFQNADSFFSIDEIHERKFYIARAYLRMAKCYEKLGEKKTQFKMLEKALTEISYALRFPTQEHIVMANQVYRALEQFHFEQKLPSNNYLTCAQELIDDHLQISSDTNNVMKNELMLQSYYKGKLAKSVETQAKHYWESYIYFKDFISKQYQDQDQLLQLQESNTIQTEFIQFFSELYLKSQQEKYLLYTLEIVENSKSNILYKRNSGFNHLKLKDYLAITDLQNYKNKIHLSPLLDTYTLKNYFQKYYQNKAFISYFVLPEAMLTIGYSNGKFHLERKKLSQDWFNLKDFFQDYLPKSNYFLPRYFSQKLTRLHHWLIPEWLHHSSQNRLVASMHKDIAFLPLEIIMYKDEFLVQNFAISYCFSLHHDLEFCSIQKTKSQLDILGISPFSNTDLPYSHKEVSAFSTHTLNNTEANYQKVLEQIQKHNVVHFATHTQLGTQLGESEIIFYPLDTQKKNSVKLDEISDLDMSHVDLVTLSTCSSAEGIYLDGEGVISLQRSFAYAQVPSILAGKWKVHDQSSMYIMTTFYKHLKEGWSKDIALQKAKKNFIAKNPDLAHNPMFWGSFVMNGSTINLYPPSPLVEIETFFNFR
ncbi:CHAT domain-containing protein [Sediminitomix flava]|uniref:CHAT domain-containing protein n=1 Tax=Sediminitomix flava TaxID=379075 RepID=A0A315Z559_SEDFL|nr:CHAT domain-containing protein [Sediminitomix flava]PWJ38023.1 CHAT domain-containing protein [Sediminitomix flava]